MQAQAQALGIDLNPRPTGSTEDRPVYEQVGRAQQPQQQGYYPPQQQGGYSPQGYQQQQPYPAQQQYGLPAQYGGRPASARPAVGGPHPFDLPPQQQGYGQPGGQLQQQQRHGQSAPAPPGYPQQQQQNQQPGRGGAQQQQPSAAVNQYDQMADDIQRMQLGTAEFNRLKAQAQAHQQANAGPLGQRDHVKGVFYAEPLVRAWSRGCVCVCVWGGTY